MIKQTVTQSLSLCYYSKFSDVNVTGGGVWYPGEQVVVEGNLIFDQFGAWNLLGGVTVKLTFAGNTYKTTTSTSITSQYGFQFNITVPPLADGQYDAVLSFDGSGSVWLLNCVSPCSYAFMVTIQSQGSQTATTPQPPPQVQYPSQLSLTISPSSVTVGQSVTITATATYANGTPGSGFKIDFTVNGNMIGSASTNDSGVASVSFTPQSAGNYTVTAYLDADQSVSASASFTVSSLTAPTPQYPSQLSLSVSPSSATVGQSVTAIATATYANGTPGSGYKVDFAVNGNTIGSATTNSQGVADISFTPEAAGNYTVTAWLDADPSVSASASFTASAPTPSGTSCTSNSQCPQGYVCQNGTCVTAQGTSCTSTSQCPQGTVCQNGVCTQCNGVIVGSTCVPTWAIVAGVGAVALTGLVIAISK